MRVYNEQPTFPIEVKCLLYLIFIFRNKFLSTSDFVLQNPKSFTVELLKYLDSQAQYLHSFMSLAETGTQHASQNDHCHEVEMALEALRNIIKNNPGKLNPSTKWFLIRTMDRMNL